MADNGRHGSDACPLQVPLPSAEQLEAVRVVALRTAKGELRIKLRPDWHAPSVTYVRTVALTDTCTAKCVLQESPHRPSRSKLAVTAPGRL